jgi:hypothetical protein
MVLNSDELEVLDYLKGHKGKFVPVMEICRRAGGRNKFHDNPNWARTLMSRLIDAKFVEANERGHYRIVEQNKPKSLPRMNETPQFTGSMLVDEDYFPVVGSAPAPQSKFVVDENYFPPAEAADAQPERWSSDIVKKTGRKTGGHRSGK